MQYTKLTAKDLEEYPKIDIERSASIIQTNMVAYFMAHLSKKDTAEARKEALRRTKQCMTAVAEAFSVGDCAEGIIVEIEEGLFMALHSFGYTSMFFNNYQGAEEYLFHVNNILTGMTQQVRKEAQRRLLHEQKVVDSGNVTLN